MFLGGAQYAEHALYRRLEHVLDEIARFKVERAGGVDDCVDWWLLRDRCVERAGCGDFGHDDHLELRRVRCVLRFDRLLLSLASHSCAHIVAAGGRVSATTSCIYCVTYHAPAVQEQFEYVSCDETAGAGEQNAFPGHYSVQRRCVDWVFANGPSVQRVTV